MNFESDKQKPKFQIFQKTKKHHQLTTMYVNCPARFYLYV